MPVWTKPIGASTGFPGLQDEVSVPRIPLMRPYTSTGEAPRPGMHRKFKLVISDLHMGTGQFKGRANVLEDFGSDERVADLLDYYSTGPWADCDAELIINGDLFDMLKVPYNGTFPDRITEEIAVEKLRQCLAGHSHVIRAFQRWVESPYRTITYLPGNHDIDMMWPRAARLFVEAIGQGEHNDRVKVWLESDTYTLPEGIHVHHGHQFDPQNSFDYTRLFTQPTGERDEPAAPYIQYPWGSQFVLYVINPLKPHRPYIDHLRPFSQYLLVALLLDTRFALRVMWNSSVYFLQNRFRALREFSVTRDVPLTWRRVRKALLSAVQLFPSMERYARRIASRVAGVHTVIMGHSHLEKVRVFENGSVYVNTGCWIDMVNLYIGDPGRRRRRCYALIEYPSEGRPVTSLMLWHGRPRPFEQLLY
jgi:UDP-2,3-diacylglucosamine pyrophosphatase LpxH